MMYGALYQDKGSNELKSIIGYSHSMIAMIKTLEAQGHTVISCERLIECEDNRLRMAPEDIGAIIYDVLSEYLAAPLANDLIDEILDKIEDHSQEVSK